MRILDTLLPEIAGYFDHGIGTSGIAVTSYAIAYSVFQILYGPLADRIGPYLVITVASVFSALVALGCAVAASLEWLVALRFLAGAVAAAIGPLTLTFVGLVVAADQRPVIIANMTGASIAGVVAGQVGGGFFGAWLNWQASFVMIAGLFLLAGTSMLCIGARNHRLFRIGRENASKHRKPGLATLLQLVRRPVVLTLLLGVAVEGLALFMSLTYVAASIEPKLSIGPVFTAVLIGMFGLGSLLYILFVRLLVVALNEPRRAIAGGLSMAMGYVLLTVAQSLGVASMAMMLVGLGFMMLHNVLQIRALQMAPDVPATAISLFAAAFFFAQAIGAFLGGLAFDRVGGTPLFLTSAALLAGLGVFAGLQRSPMVNAVEGAR